jgi:hypothetical protein
MQDESKTPDAKRHCRHLTLEDKFPMPREGRIVLKDPEHVYTIDGVVTNRLSVSKLAHLPFPEFDSVAVAMTMVTRCDFGTNPRYKQYQDLVVDKQTKQELGELICHQWQECCKAAADLGTHLHANIEDYLNDNPMNDSSTEFGYFLEYNKAQLAKGWEVYRTEVRVFNHGVGDEHASCEREICGTVDVIYREQLAKGGVVYHLRDWKRSKKINKHGFGKSGNGIFSILPDCNYSQYTLQLNIYKFLLDKYYETPIQDMGIVVFHPNNQGFQEYEIKYLPELTRQLMSTASV